MALESYSELRTRLLKDLNRTTETLRSMKQQLDSLNSHLQKVKVAQESAQAECQEAGRELSNQQNRFFQAKKRLLDAQRNTNIIGKSKKVRALDKQVKNLEELKHTIMNRIRHVKEENNDYRTKIGQLEKRAQIIHTRVHLHKSSETVQAMTNQTDHRQLLDWEFITGTSDESFDELVRQIESILKAHAKWREASADHK